MFYFYGHVLRNKKNEKEKKWIDEEQTKNTKSYLALFPFYGCGGKLCGSFFKEGKSLDKF